MKHLKQMKEKKGGFYFSEEKGGMSRARPPVPGEKRCSPKKVSFVSNLSFHSTYHEM
jgi:hypothetical protein